MATVKALADQRGEKADFVTSPFCESLIPYLEGQPYIARARVAWNWEIISSCPGLQPWRCPPGSAVGPTAPGTESGECSPAQEDAIHLGLREWPMPNLFQYYGALGAVVPSPFWLSPVPQYGWSEPGQFKDVITVAFTDEWVELKVGLLAAILPRFQDRQFQILCREDSRLHREFSLPFNNVRFIPCGFMTASCYIHSSRLLLTDKSVFRVMAIGMGHPLLVSDPCPWRHN